MPYDPRPRSEGGNRGIDEVFSRNAPKGKFRVVSVDTFDGSDALEGDFGTLDAAKIYARDFVKGEEMCKVHIYDDTGAHRYDCGTC